MFCIIHVVWETIKLGAVRQLIFKEFQGLVISCCWWSNKVAVKSVLQPIGPPSQSLSWFSSGIKWSGLLQLHPVSLIQGGVGNHYKVTKDFFMTSKVLYGIIKKLLTSPDSWVKYVLFLSHHIKWMGIMFKLHLIFFLGL